MSSGGASIEKSVHLSAECADRLGRLAQARETSEDLIVEKALNVLFELADLLEQDKESRGWSLLSEASLRRVWENDEDTVYDNWKDLYDVPTR
jgi:predicted transcriptional regulator